MQMVKVLFRAKHPELCLIWRKGNCTCLQKQWLGSLAAAPEWPWCWPQPQWSPESWATADAPNTSSLLIKVKEQQEEREYLTVRQSSPTGQPQISAFKSHSIKSEPTNTIVEQKLFFSTCAAVSQHPLCWYNPLFPQPLPLLIDPTPPSDQRWQPGRQQRRGFPGVPGCRQGCSPPPCRARAVSPLSSDGPVTDGANKIFYGSLF